MDEVQTPALVPGQFTPVPPPQLNRSSKYDWPPLIAACQERPGDTLYMGVIGKSGSAASAAKNASLRHGVDLRVVTRRVELGESQVHWWIYVPKA